MIGTLLYLTASRLHMIFRLCLCACFHANPKESQLIEVKRIFKYIHRTKDFNLWYPSCDDFGLIDFSNADYVRYKVDRKSTSRSCRFLRLSLNI